MPNLSRANVHDVLRNAPRDRHVIVQSETGKPERRTIKRPEGRMVEQMVDPQGNVVWIKLLAFGTNHGPEHAAGERLKMHSLGFVEYHWCPLRHGTRHENAKLEEDFATMPAELQKPCAADPVIHERRGKITYAHDACEHVEWLVAERRRRAAEEAELRATKIETAADIEKQKLAVAQMQLEEQRETNKRTTQLLEQLAGNAAKPKKDKAGE
jgi:hypothetical protein